MTDTVLCNGLLAVTMRMYIPLTSARTIILVQWPIIYTALSPVAFISQLDFLQTVPRFAAQRRDVKCDVIVVDGGHSHDVAIRDLNNYRDLANVERNVLDDTNKQVITTACNYVRICISLYQMTGIQICRAYHNKT